MRRKEAAKARAIVIRQHRAEAVLKRHEEVAQVIARRVEKDSYGEIVEA